MSTVPNQQPGGLPLIPAYRFDAAMGGNQWPYRRVGYIMEFLQRRLHEQSQVEGSVDLNTVYRWGWNRKWKSAYFQIPYHEYVVPHWTAFCDAKKSQGDGMEMFMIRDVVLPPAPFFANQLMPILTKNHASLTRLELVHCELGSHGIAGVADFLTNYGASLTTLDLSNNRIEDVDDAEILSLAIWNHSELRFVNFSWCGIGGNIAVLSELLGGAGNLETLLLEHNNINSAGITLVANFLASNTTMTALSLANNDISADDAEILGRALRKNQQLRQLNLASSRPHRCTCRTWGLEFTTFLDSKRATELLTYLDLSCNNIATEGLEVVADFLARNPVLTELNLQGNSLNSGTANTLARALKQNTSLLHLNLRGNNFSDKAVPFFVDLLRNNTALLSLDLVWNENLRVKTGRKELIKQALCDTSSLDAIVESNHTCALKLSEGKGKGTYEVEMRNISTLDNEGMKIRYKVVLALFAMDNDLFNPRNFSDIYLELMPRLLELVQQEVGYGGFGEGVVEKTKKRRKGGFNPTLGRLYEIVHGWISMPLLFVRGPGKLKQKRKRKRHVMSFNEDEDEEWTPKSR